MRMLAETRPQPNDKPAAFGRQQAQDSAPLYDERALRNQMVYLSRNNNMNCMRCHIQEPRDFRIPELNYRALDRFGGANAEFFRKEDPAAREAREIEKFNQGTPLEKVIQLASRLPAKADFELKPNSLKLETNFAATLEAIPGVKLDKVWRDVLSGVKSLSLDGNSFSMKLEKAQGIPIDAAVPMIGKFKQITFGGGDSQLNFDIALDPKDPKSVSLKNIRGLALTMDTGKSIAIEALTLDTSSGNPRIVATIQNPFDVKFPKTITLPMPLEKVAPGIGADAIRSVLKTAADAKALLQTRDFSPYLENIPDADLRGKIAGMLKGVTSISKDGQTIRIVRDGGTTAHDFGGPQLQVLRSVSFKIGDDPKNPKIHEISGINFSLPLPEKLGLGSKFTTSLTELQLLDKDGQGNRTLIVKTNHMIDSVRIKLGPDMNPVADSDGNWYAQTRMTNPLSDSGRDKLHIRLRIDKNGQLNMSPSEIADIIGDATLQAADLSVAGGGLVVSGVVAKVFSFGHWLLFE